MRGMNQLTAQYMVSWRLRRRQPGSMDSVIYAQWTVLTSSSTATTSSIHPTLLVIFRKQRHGSFSSYIFYTFQSSAFFMKFIMFRQGRIKALRGPRPKIFCVPHYTKVCTDHGKSWNFIVQNSRSGKSREKA